MAIIANVSAKLPNNVSILLCSERRTVRWPYNRAANFATAVVNMLSSNVRLS
jgi:hypothetical protein